VGNIGLILKEFKMRYLGIDVAKLKLDCCLLFDETGTKRKIKVIPNTATGIASLAQWLSHHEVALGHVHVIMEATGAYHEQAALSLVECGIMVSIINPALVKDFGRSLAIRTKTDGVDSFVLARYGALLKPKPWQPPPVEARLLQALIVRRDAVADDLRRELNRQEKCMCTHTHQLIAQSMVQSITFLQTELKRLQQAIDDHIDQYPLNRHHFYRHYSAVFLN
jgi:transposase